MECKCGCRGVRCRYEIRGAGGRLYVAERRKRCESREDSKASKFVPSFDKEARSLRLRGDWRLVWGGHGVAHVVTRTGTDAFVFELSRHQAKFRAGEGEGEGAVPAVNPLTK